MECQLRFAWREQFCNNAGGGVCGIWSSGIHRDCGWRHSWRRRIDSMCTLYSTLVHVKHHVHPLCPWRGPTEHCCSFVVIVPHATPLFKILPPHGTVAACPDSRERLCVVLLCVPVGRTEQQEW